MIRRTTACLALFLFSGVLQADVDEREPTAADPAADGAVHEWTSTGGIRFQYRVPESYDAEAGVGLTLILHGSNLDRRWGFANHRSDTFRPDDVVVSPDGTTPNGQGGFNLMGRDVDAKLVHGLIEELREIWNVRAVWAYGHSQGSFFALYHAGLYPEDLQGIVGHASGIWTWTTLGKKGHAIPIVMLHGTQDPVVPYGQSVGGYQSLLDAKYPLARLRSLEGWNHWPCEHNLNHLGQAVPHTSQQLAWVEGMATTDADRLEVSFELLRDNRLGERHDYAAAYTLAARIATLEELPDRLRRDAGRVQDAVDDLARDHVRELDLPKKLALEDEAWVGHLPMFLRAFSGVPACDELKKKRKRDLEAHDKAGEKAFRTYWGALERSDRAEAFEAGVDALEDAFLYYQTADARFRDNMREWRAAADELRLSKKLLKRYDESFEVFEEALKEGRDAFDRVNRKASDLR